MDANKDRERFRRSRAPPPLLHPYELEEVADAMRTLLYKLHFSREAAAKTILRTSQCEQEDLLFVHTVGPFQMLVLLRPQEILKSVIIDLWNIGLQHLSCLIGLSHEEA